MVAELIQRVLGTARVANHTNLRPCFKRVYFNLFHLGGLHLSLLPQWKVTYDFSASLRRHLSRP